MLCSNISAYFAMEISYAQLCAKRKKNCGWRSLLKIIHDCVKFEKLPINFMKIPNPEGCVRGSFEKKNKKKNTTHREESQWKDRRYANNLYIFILSKIVFTPWVSSAIIEKDVIADCLMILCIHQSKKGRTRQRDQRSRMLKWVAYFSIDSLTSSAQIFMVLAQ